MEKQASEQQGARAGGGAEFGTIDKPGRQKHDGAKLEMNTLLDDRTMDKAEVSTRTATASSSDTHLFSNTHKICVGAYVH